MQTSRLPSSPFVSKDSAGPSPYISKASTISSCAQQVLIKIHALKSILFHTIIFIRMNTLQPQKKY